MKSDNLRPELNIEDEDPLPEDFEIECYMTEPADLADLDEICAMDELMATQPGRREMVERAIRNKTCKIVADSKQLLAYGIFDYSHKHQGCVKLIYVRPEHRRDGVGSELLMSFEAVCEKPQIYCSVPKSNLAAQALVESVGYRTAKGFAGDGQDLYVKNIWEPMPEEISGTIQ